MANKEQDIRKAAEECSELATVLIQQLNKPHKDLSEHIIEEAGDVLFRVENLRSHFDSNAIDNRALKKAAKHNKASPSGGRKNYDVTGEYITVNCWNSYFDQVCTMILEHFDKPEYKDVVFVLGSYIFIDHVILQKKYNGKRIIIYQMEQLFRSPNKNDLHWVNVNGIINTLRKANKSGVEIWDMDFVNSIFLRDNGVEINKVVPLRFTKSLEELNSKTEEEIDVFFYGNLNSIRGKKLAKLAYQFYHEGVSIMWISNLDFHIQKRYMEKSKIILNIHHTDSFNRQEQPRIFYALINKKCVLSEPSQKNHFGDAIVESDDFLKSIKHLLKNNNYKKQAAKGYEIFKNMELN